MPGDSNSDKEKLAMQGGASRRGTQDTDRNNNEHDCTVHQLFQREKACQGMSSFSRDTCDQSLVSDSVDRRCRGASCSVSSILLGVTNATGLRGHLGTTGLSLCTAHVRTQHPMQHHIRLSYPNVSMDTSWDGVVAPRTAVPTAIRCDR